MYQEIFETLQKKSLELRSEKIEQRLKRLKTLRKWVIANRSRIQEAVYKDLRKPAEEADLTEIYVALTELKKAIRNLKYWNIPDAEGTSMPFIGTKAEVYYEPKGISLIISPWNYPFNLAMGPLISAIAAGNTVIMKPSELSHHTSKLLKEMVDETLDPKIVQVVNGGIESSTELLKLPFDHIFFTGSPRVGKVVMEAASKHLASVTLELGGKSPCIVDESANIKDAAEKLAWGKWLNAGQICVAPDYFFVHEKVKDRFLSLLKEEAEKMYGGDDYSSIISDGHFERLNTWKSEAIQDGAKVFFEGQSQADLRRMAPTIIEDAKPGTHLHDSEIFGPICMVKTFRNISDVVEIINSRPKALSSYIFARNKKVINELKQRTSSGSFVINDTVIQFGHPTMPFGGVNNSGIGKSHGKRGFLAFSNEKSVLKQRIGFTMPKLLYPPFNGFKRFIINLLLKYF